MIMQRGREKTSIVNENKILEQKSHLISKSDKYSIQIDFDGDNFDIKTDLDENDIITLLLKVILTLYAGRVDSIKTDSSDNKGIGTTP